MRRFLPGLLLLLLALGVPFSTFAQDQELVWELDAENYLDVSDIGLRFYYPVGWVWGSGSGGISFAENQADLDAQLDDDVETIAEGRVMSVLGIPLESLPPSDEPQDMQDYADFIVEVGEITEVEARVEFPVMSRRSVSVIGENTRGRFGIGTIWTQNGYLVLTSFGTPDQATLNEGAYSWGVTIGSTKPLEAEELGKDRLVGETTPFTMNYPTTWTADEKQPTLVVFEQEDDIGKELPEIEGISVTMAERPIADLGFEADATLEDVTNQLNTSFGLDETATHEEFFFLNQPAQVSIGEIADGSGGTKGLILTTTVTEEANVIIFVLIAPTVERAVEFMPTWVAMMQTVTSTAE